MAEIRIVSRSTIGAALCVHESVDRIELTTWDLRYLLIGSVQKGLLYLKPKPLSLQNQLIFIEHLKASLSKTLSFFPPLAGRLSAVNNSDDTTTSFFIDCNNAGAEFTHAVADDLTVADILMHDNVPRVVHSFFTMNGVKNHEGISNPLLAVQVTELIDGIFIGVTMNHVVGDGSCFWHFFNSWSEISRGFEKISRSPFLKRWFPEDVQYPIQIPQFEQQQLNDQFIPPPLLRERVFHFTKSKIAELKSRANSQMGSTKLSSLQALMAHLWRSVIRCQKYLNDDQETTIFRVVIGARQRLIPPLPRNYFGNAVHGRPVMVKTGELINRELGWAAMEMNKTIGYESNDELIRNWFKQWAKRPELVTMSGLARKALILSSSPRFDMYGNDFGWGTPVAVRSGEANKFAGKITVFQGREEGSVDIEVCLSPETLVAMGDDAEFMEALAPSDPC